MAELPVAVLDQIVRQQEEIRNLKAALVEIRALQYPGWIAWFDDLLKRHDLNPEDFT